MNAEVKRLALSKNNTNWKKWGPYLTERQWGTVREDYSRDGSAWESVTHDDARSNAYRWGEEGIGGISDNRQHFCIAFAFWNKKDGILKERIFGLTGNEGNHGEDVKELYYYLDSTPTHSYMKMLYKYPQAEFPYVQLVKENRRRGKNEPEYEIWDTGVFDEDKYFDIFIEYAKADQDDLLIKLTVHNRGDEDAPINVLPTFWFRNTWRLHYSNSVPTLIGVDDHHIEFEHVDMGLYNIYFDGQITETLFCNNETNRKRLFGTESHTEYYKDGVNDYIVNNDKNAINPRKRGTKAAANYDVVVPAKSSVEVKFRVTNQTLEKPFEDYDTLFNLRIQEADAFYADIQDKVSDVEHRRIQRQAFGGLLWTKQFYYYNISEWLEGDSGKHSPPEERKKGRNSHWKHLHNEDIISMPDKWEYPWYAAWDLAFHTIPIARIDPDFAKEQLLLLLNDWYLHPNGQMPAYEWNFSDVNPPVHAWAVLRVFHIDKKKSGSKGDLEFLEKAFHKLIMNFTWWVNRKDSEGNNIFEGGFLGLDNIGVFDRSNPLPTGGRLEQADGTSWMAMFSLNMLRIALDLANESPVYQDMAIKYFEHFLSIAKAIHNDDPAQSGLWDEEDKFYYDVLHHSDGTRHPMKIRSMVGIIPLFAVETLKKDTYQKLSEFRKRLEFYSKVRPNLAKLVSRWEEEGKEGRRLFSLLRGYRMTKLMEKVLDEKEFLSDYGIRALSKYHQDNPYRFVYEGQTHTVSYQPGESDTRMFGGNSNWRGPIWFPVNYLVLESLWKFDFYYDETFKIECPTGSGTYLSIKEISENLSHRMINIFMPDKDGVRPSARRWPKMNSDPHFKDHILFYEYFHGDDGAGCGASHQTGWTALVADIIYRLYKEK